MNINEEKQMKNRIRFLSDKMESLWEEISPKIDEFEQCRKEFENILDRLLKENKDDT